MTGPRNNPRYPVFIISKGRWDSRLTSKSFEAMGVPYRIVVEPQEYDSYAAVIDPAKILVTPFSNLGQGSIPARNFVWDTADAEGADKHWCVDDNVQWFFRFHRNMKVPADDGTIFYAAEDFVERYLNVAQAGFQYYMFLPRKEKKPPFYLNTRVYSCILNSSIHRTPSGERYSWRGRYNEDTDLSIRILKDGWCTILFNAFMCNKITTLQMKGGNTDELYKDDGRLQMAQSLVDQHPDVVRITKRWGRYQHLVDYRPFKANLLRRKPGLEIPQGADDFGMVFQERDESGLWVTKDPIEPMKRWFQDAPIRDIASKSVQRRRVIQTADAAPAGPDWFDRAMAAGLLEEETEA